MFLGLMWVLFIIAAVFLAGVVAVFALSVAGCILYLPFGIFFWIREGYLAAKNRERMYISR